MDILRGFGLVWKQCFVCLILILAGDSYAQDMSEVYQLDLVNVERRGSSLESQTLYFISMGISELQDLRSEKFKGTIDDVSLARLAALEEALAPVIEVQEELSREPSREEFRKTMVLQKKLMRDPITAFQVFESLGPERASQLAMRYTGIALKSKISNPDKDVQGVSLLNLGIVAKFLELTDDQREKISDITSSFSKPLKRGEEGSFDEYDQLLSEHWDNLLSILEPTQRSSAIQFVGSPVNWFRAGKNEPLRQRNFASKPGAAAVTGLESVDWGSGIAKPNVYQMSREELESKGVRTIPCSSYEMFRSRFVWSELELTDEQRGKMKRFNVSPSVSFPRFQTGRLSELLEGQSDYPKELSDVLLDHQIELLQQFEVQVLTGLHESSIGLAHPEMIAKLEITEAQQSEIASQAMEFKSKARLLFEKIAEGRKASKAELEARLVSVLNAKQKRKLRQLQER